MDVVLDPVLIAVYTVVLLSFAITIATLLR
jgi:hypothetical protein